MNPQSPVQTHAKQGLFISFEGIDGAGKSTHIQALAKAFESQGYPVVLTREVGGTPLAEQLREMLLHQEMDALTEALLAFAARRDHIRQVIAPALARGSIVISDRFADASFAYQGAGRGLPWEDLQAIERICLQHPEQDCGQGALLQPDITLWFDVDPATAAQRLASARLPDRFEAQPQAFFAAVAAGYARRYAEDSQRFVRIQADAPPAQVWHQVQQAFAQRGYWGNKPTVGQLS